MALVILTLISTIIVRDKVLIESLNAYKFASYFLAYVMFIYYINELLILYSKYIKG